MKTALDIVRELAAYPERASEHYQENPHAAYLAALWLQSIAADARAELVRLGYRDNPEG